MWVLFLQYLSIYQLNLDDHWPIAQYVGFLPPASIYQFAWFRQQFSNPFCIYTLSFSDFVSLLYVVIYSTIVRSMYIYFGAQPVFLSIWTVFYDRSGPIFSLLFTLQFVFPSLRLFSGRLLLSPLLSWCFLWVVIFALIHGWGMTMPSPF